MNIISKAALIGLSIVLGLPAKAMTHLEQAKARPIRITEVLSDRKIDQIVISNSTDGEKFMAVNWISGLSAGWFSSVWSKKVDILANWAPGRTLREQLAGEEPLIPGARVLDLKITVNFDREKRYIKKDDGTIEEVPAREDEYKITIISLDDVDEGSYTLHIDEDGTASLQKQKDFFG